MAEIQITERATKRADSGDRICVLWKGGVTPGIYADHRDGGRVIVDDEGPVLMKLSEFGRHALRPGEGADWGGPLDRAYERLLADSLVDDTTEPSNA